MIEKNLRFDLLAAALLALASTACAPKIYGVKMDAVAKREIGTEISPVTAEARRVVHGATTVAFFPPDKCLDVKAAGAGAETVTDVLRMSCGVLMTELEAAATRNGFQVVSWQTLRGPGRPIEYARENKVDLLFEINELSVDVPPQDLYTVADVSFFQRGRTDPDAPVVDSPLMVRDAKSVAETCRDLLWKSLPPTAAVTLDMKMVSVADGRVRWAYRTTKRENGDPKISLKRTYETQGQMSTAAGTVALLGGIFGATFVVGAAVSSGQGDQNTANAMWGAAAISAAVGLIALILPKEYEPPETVMCKQPALEDAPPPETPAAPDESSHVVLTEKTQLQGNDLEARRRKLLASVIDELMKSLSEMRAQGVAAPAVPAAPAAPIAPVVPK